MVMVVGIWGKLIVNFIWVNMDNSDIFEQSDYIGSYIYDTRDKLVLDCKMLIIAGLLPWWVAGLGDGEFIKSCFKIKEVNHECN